MVNFNSNFIITKDNDIKNKLCNMGCSLLNKTNDFFVFNNMLKNQCSYSLLHDMNIDSSKIYFTNKLFFRK